MNPYLALLRPQQSVKNLLVFFPAFFALRITEPKLLTQTALAFIAFTLVAGGVYIFNDLMDRPRDRQHPIKRHRPLAAGKVRTPYAIGLMALCWLLGLGGFFWLDLMAALLALAYVALNIAYSLWLKHISLLDLTLVALGFVLRVGIGGAVGAIPLSMWIILMVFLGALFLGLAKRRDDVKLAATGRQVRKAIDGYNLLFIDSAMMVMASVLIVAYISYTISPQVQQRLGSEYMYVSVLFVVLGILRYLQLTLVEERTGNPTQLLLSDRFLQLTILGWVGTCVYLIYA